MSGAGGRGLSRGLEEQSFTNLCRWYRKELLQLHATGVLPQCITRAKAKRLAKRGILDTSNRFHRYAVTPAALQILEEIIMTEKMEEIEF